MLLVCVGGDAQMIQASDLFLSPNDMFYDVT